MGFVNKVVSGDELMDEAMAVARRIVANPRYPCGASRSWYTEPGPHHRGGLFPHI